MIKLKLEINCRKCDKKLFVVSKINTLTNDQSWAIDIFCPFCNDDTTVMLHPEQITTYSKVFEFERSDMDGMSPQ